MVDYRRFEAIDVSDDEADGPARPRVTRLEGPTTVRIGGQHPPVADPRGGASASLAASQRANAGPKPNADYSKWEALARELSDSEDDGEEAAEEAVGEEGHASPPPPPPAPRLPPAVPEGGLEHTAADTLAERTRRGGQTERYLWSQTKGEVTAFFYVPADTRAKQVKLTLAREHVRLELSGARVLVHGEWSHAITPPEDEDDQGDWELLGGGEGADGVGPAARLLRLTVRKDSPAGVTVWWERLLRGDPAIDVSVFEGHDAAASAKLQASWDEAHRLFKERVKAHKPIEIDVTAE